jgi:hypothetical protein
MLAAVVIGFLVGVIVLLWWLRVWHHKKDVVLRFEVKTEG